MQNKERLSNSEIISREIEKALRQTRITEPTENLDSKVIARFFCLDCRFYALGSTDSSRIYGAALKEAKLEFGSMTTDELCTIRLKSPEGKMIGMQSDKSVVPFKMTLRECLREYERTQPEYGRESAAGQVLTTETQKPNSDIEQTPRITADPGNPDKRNLSEAARKVLNALMTGISVRIINQEHLERIEEALSGRFLDLEKEGKVPILTIYDRNAPSRTPIHIQGPTQSQQRER